jgi:hypothetical protein
LFQGICALAAPPVPGPEAAAASLKIAVRVGAQGLLSRAEQHYSVFRDLRAAAGRPLPDFVQQEFDAYLKC